jgi:thymidylate synthase (FAD)
MSEAKLVWATPDAEDVIAYCARVSNPSNQNNTQTAPKLLKYLRDHKHWSPFEMASVCMEINTTRDIARQVLRHRSFSFQEFSQRYAETLGFEEPTSPRLQDTKNRQASIELLAEDEYLDQWWKCAQVRVTGEVIYLYQQALEKGIAKEVARKLLPEGLTQSRLYMSGTVRSWLHFVDVRTGPETQKEHRDLANQCLTVLQSVSPAIFGGTL